MSGKETGERVLLCLNAMSFLFEGSLICINFVCVLRVTNIMTGAVLEHSTIVCDDELSLTFTKGSMFIGNPWRIGGFEKVI